MRPTNCIFCGVLLKPSRSEKPDSAPTSTFTHGGIETMW